MSLFNPWVLLGIVLAVLGAGTSGYFKGSADEFDRQQLEIAALNAKARETEQKLQADAQETAAKLRKQNDEASKRIANLKSDLDSGKRKLFIPVKAPDCAVHTTTDAESSSRPDTRTAEIHPETSRAILDIGNEADTTVRKLNACLAIYNQVREMINERK